LLKLRIEITRPKGGKLGNMITNDENDYNDYLLGYLMTVESASDIIPLDCSLTRPTEQLCEFVENRLNVTIAFGHDYPGFPNTRQNIDYFFSDPAHFQIVIGGGLREETALRILFFTAHGIGHAITRRDEALCNLQDSLIHHASNLLGSRHMEELVDFQGETKPFRLWFTPHELLASRIGWMLVKKCLRENNYDWKELQTIKFWYSLYGTVDHCYHRQSVVGPWPADRTQWRKVFGE